MTRLASFPRVCSSCLFYDGCQRQLVRHVPRCGAASRAATSAQAVGSWPGTRTVRAAQPEVAQVPHRVTTVGQCCSAVQPMYSALGCLFASHVRTLCSLAAVLWSFRARTQRLARMHDLCRASQPSRGARASRERNFAARCRVVARKVPTVACGQNSGQFWTLTMIFGVLDMPEWS